MKCFGNERDALPVFLKTVVVCVGLWSFPQEASSSKAPNILFVIADDLGWKDLACYGNPYHETPNLDKLARQGMRFTDAYAAAAICSPTRASLVTGKYPARLGLTDWIKGFVYPEKPLLCPTPNQYLPLEEITIAEALKNVGYRNYMLGKWHLGNVAYYPEEQGFDEVFMATHAGSPKSYFSPYRLKIIKDGPDGEYLTDRITNEALTMLKKSQSEAKPWFMYLSYCSVHSPVMSKKETQEGYKAKGKKGKWGSFKFAAMLDHLDENIGRLMKYLDDTGLSENTVVIFYSDNGGKATSQHPLRGNKGQQYEGGIRVPLIVRYPKIVEAGSTSDVPVTSPDFYPTLLEMAGAKPMPEQHKDGVSLVPLFKGRKIDRDAVYFHYPHYCLQHKGYPSSVVRKGQYKLIQFFEDHRIELYNLKDDIGEKNNLFETKPEIAKQLYAQLAGWQKDVGAKLPSVK
jgi:arylsulfatase A-like enzyme